MFPGGTVFPEGLAVGSSFDLDLVKAIYAAAAAEARAVGIHMLSTLVMEVDRDPRMGRNEEAYTEDPYLYMRIGETIVRAAQGSDISAPDKVIAVLTDFPTQSEPVERPRARSDRGIGAFLARELYAAVDRRHHQSRRLGRDGGLPGNRGCAGARLGEVDERCLAAGNRFQGSRRERRRRLRHLDLRAHRSHPEGSGSAGLEGRRRFEHHLRAGLHGAAGRERGRGPGSHGAGGSRGAQSSGA